MRGTRTRIATGIYRDATGIAIVTKVNGVQKERRYKPDASLTKLIAIRANWIVERESGEVAEPTTPYWDAAREYLKTIPPDTETKRHANAFNDLDCWRETFHGLNVTAITPALIQQQLATWVADFKPSTLNKRRQELKNLFDFLRLSVNPVSGVPKLIERHDDARGVSPEVVEAVLSHFNDDALHTRLRLRVMWETSLAPVDLERIEAAQFRPRERTIYVPARRKGAGAPALTMSLTRNGVRALNAFFAAGLEGKAFTSSGGMHRMFRDATAKAKAEWKHGAWPAPENFSPKDLRHSRLTEALRRSKNLQGVRQLARHKRIETTMRYVRALESDALKQVTASMEPDGTVPSRNDKRRQNRRKRTTGKSGKKQRRSQ